MASCLLRSQRGAPGGGLGGWGEWLNGPSTGVQVYRCVLIGRSMFTEQGGRWEAFVRLDASLHSVCMHTAFVSVVLHIF